MNGKVIFLRALKKFLQINGTQWAAAFAYETFLSLVPLVILLVTITSIFVDQAAAAASVIATLKTLVPIGPEMQAAVFNAISGVLHADRGTGVAAFIMLIWAASQCFTTLISATNRAWALEGYSWWRLPLRSLFLWVVIESLFLLGITVPFILKITWRWLFRGTESNVLFYILGTVLIPSLGVFFCLSLLFQFTPHRSTRFGEVWVPALFTTVLLYGFGASFAHYLEHFAGPNAVSGVLGAVMALLLWIYLSGSIFIFGTCLCAAQAEWRSDLEKEPIASR